MSTFSNPIHIRASCPANGSAEWPPDDRLRRGIQYAAAYRFNHRRLWNTGSRAFAGDDDGRRCARNHQNTPSRSRGPIARVLSDRFPQKERAGNAGCALHPRSRVQNCAKEPHTSIQVQRKHSGIPRAMALRLMARSPRRRIRLVTVIGGLKVLRTRLDSKKLRRLDTSNGCQNHTLLPYASASFVWRAKIAHGKPPCDHPSRPTLPRPPHPLPRFVTIAIRPSCRERMGRVVSLICPTL
jgi:hypothetical protein